MQGLTKVLSGRLGQVDFEVGQVAFQGHLPNEQVPAQRASAQANPPSNYILSLSYN